MIKVLHIVGKMDMAGLETLMMTFYRNIDRNKIQFDFIALSGQKGFYDDEIAFLGGKVLYPPETYNWKKPAVFKKWFEKILSTMKYDIIHSHNGGAASVIFSVAKKYGIRTILHSHHASTKKENFVKGIGRKIARYSSFKNIDLFLACSNEAGKFMFGKKDFIILNNAIDVNKFIFNNEMRSLIRRKLDIEEQYIIGTVGRLTEQKNPLGIVDIFSRVLSYYPNCKLLWIGKGECKDEIEKKIYQEKLQNKIMMIGAVDNVNEMMQAMDLFILPSLLEGLGIVAIEAQAAGLPTICSSTVPKLAAATNLCEFEDINDIDAWAKRILKHINNPIERENTLQQIIESGFDIQNESQKLSDIYVKLCGVGDI